MSTRSNPVHVLPYAKALLEQMEQQAFDMDAASPHVVLIIDPETNRMSAVGPYATRAEAIEHAELLDVQMNSPQNNNGALILFKPIVLETEQAELEPFPVRQYLSATTGRGYIRFVNVRPEMKSPQCWLCDACGQRVPLGKQRAHAKGHR